MGNSESNNYENINESNILTDNIDISYSDEYIENINLINNNYKKKKKSLYSFGNMYLYYSKDNNGNKKFNNIYCKLKYYPDYICIKDSCKIYHTYTYYQIKSWAYGKNNFILNTVNNTTVFLKYDTPIKCAKKLKKICDEINKNN